MFNVLMNLRVVDSYMLTNHALLKRVLARSRGMRGVHDQGQNVLDEAGIGQGLGLYGDASKPAVVLQVREVDSTRSSDVA